MTNARKNSPLKKPLLKALSLFGALLMLIPLLTACAVFGGDSDKDAPVGDAALIRECIETFSTAYNSGDMDAVLECLDAKSRNAMEAMLQLLGGIAGSYAGFEIDLKDLFSLGVSTVDGDFMVLQITEVAVVGKSKATVTTVMSLPGGMDEEKIYFHMIYENERWCINDISDQKGGVNNNDDGNHDSDTTVSIIPTKLYATNSTVTFMMGEKEYAGAVNSNGEIFYYIEDDYLSWKTVGNGIGCVISTENGVNTFDIVNQEGSVIATFKEKIDFDEIVGYGDGTMLVYKNTSDISKTEHCYGLIDCNSGEWISPLTPCEYLDDDRGGLDYMGDGIFLAHNYFWSTDYYMIYNARTNDVLKVTTRYGSMETSLINGLLYGKNCDDPEDYPYFAMDLDGNITEIGPFVTGKGNIVVCEDDATGCYKICNLSTGTSAVYDDFTIQNIHEFTIVDEYILFKITGADGKYYIVLADSSGNACFEPIAAARNTISVIDNRIIYCAYDKEQYNLIDFQGNAVVSEKRGYTYMMFVEGSSLVYVKNADGEISFLNQNGEPVTITLPKK